MTNPNQHNVPVEAYYWRGRSARDMSTWPKEEKAVPEPHSELAEVIRRALIDAHPGPLDEHDAMCSIHFALPGVCNCSVARNAEAREALKSLVEQYQAALALLAAAALLLRYPASADGPGDGFVQECRAWLDRYDSNTGKSPEE